MAVCSGDAEYDAAAAGRYDYDAAGAGRYDDYDDDVKDVDQYAPRYGGQYVVGAVKGADSDTFV